MMTHAPHARATTGSRLGLLLIAVMLLMALLLESTDSAQAHAALDSSTPIAGEVVTTAPSDVTLTFTEPLEQSYSRLELYDSQGFKVEGTSLSFGDDGFSMTLTLPANLPNGTWSVLWRTLSEADGHTAQNYITFTVGSNADIAAIVIPGTGTDGDAVPQWAKTTSRWLALIGAALLIAAWPVWSTIIRPGLGGTRPQARRWVGLLRRYLVVAIALALVGSLYALVVQALTLPDGSLLDKVINTLGQTRYGKLWLLRFGLLLCLALVLPACGWWLARRRQVEGLIAWGLGIGVVIPFSLIAHASAQPSGRTVALVADAVHLYASSLWFGGNVLLLAVLLPGLRNVPESERSSILRAALPRFTLMALSAMAAIGITGFYAGWLHVGNLAALTGTDYGRALMVKLVALILILTLAAINLFVIERRYTQRDAGDVSEVWTRRLRATVGGEVLLAIVLLTAVGQMTSLQPARDVMVEDSRQLSITFPDADPAAKLLLAPGIAGVNHFRLEVSGPALPPETDVLLRLTIPDQKDLGTREITLARVSGNAFEHHGSEIGIAGDWEMTVIIREPGKAQLTAVNSTSIGTTAPEVDVPANPWRFKTVGGVTGLALVIGGAIALLFGWRADRGNTRKESMGLGVAALLLGVVLLVQARIDPIIADALPTNAIGSEDVAMIERGEDIYVQQCLSCHGPTLQGDGPASAGMDPPPADFSAPHTQVHSVEDLIFWIVNGKQGTAMPAFGDSLSDQDVRDVLSYIFDVQSRFDASSQSLDPASCTVTPTTLAELETLAEQEPPAATDLPSPTGTLATAQQADAVAETTNMLLACTNAMDTMRRLSLFSDGYLSTQFAAGMPEGFAAGVATDPTPLPADARLRLDSISDIQPLADGRLLATVVVNDPSGQLDGNATGEATFTAQLVFVQVGDTWLIDEMIPAT